MQKQTRIALLGAGWLGEPLAALLRSAGYQIKAATTSAEKAERLAEKDWKTYTFRVESDHIDGDIGDFFQADILILSLPPGGRRNPEVAKTYPAKIEQVIKACQAGSIQQVIFTSSTGVYGAQNIWVDEDAALLPNTASGTALVQVEALLRDAFAEQLTILRLAGLVGGERQPGRWFAGRDQLAGGQQYINLVHRQDVMAICQAIIQSEYWGHTLNVCADEHPTKAEFYPSAAQKLGLPTPSFIAEPSAEAGKRIANERSKLVPGFDYQYPDPFDFPV